MARANPWLDLVRAAAIALVLARHGYREIHEGDPGFAGTLMLNGWVGVDLFFVLSGYLIARQLTRELGPGFDFGRYLVRRALRIVPSYLAVLALIVLGFFPLFEVELRNLGWRLLYHLLFLQDYLAADFNVVFWSLAVEEKFYLLAPFLIRIVQHAPPRRQLALLAAVALVSPALRAISFGLLQPADYEVFFRLLRSPFHTCLEPLAAGVAIAAAEAGGLLARLAGRGRAMLAAGGAGLVLWLGSHEFLGTLDGSDAVVRPAINALLCGVVTLGAVLLAGAPMPLAAAAAAVARLSYALYLVHFPLLPLAVALAGASAAGFWAVYLGLSGLAAVTLHVGIERPFLIYRDRLRDAWRPRTS
jgi:peptidoglycan/LPS O-acetylase OafA/YrhL